MLMSWGSLKYGGGFCRGYGFFSWLDGKMEPPREVHQHRILHGAEQKNDAT